MLLFCMIFYLIYAFISVTSGTYFSAEEYSLCLLLAANCVPGGYVSALRDIYRVLKPVVSLTRNIPSLLSPIKYFTLEGYF